MIEVSALRCSERWRAVAVSIASLAAAVAEVAICTKLSDCASFACRALLARRR